MQNNTVSASKEIRHDRAALCAQKVFRVKIMVPSTQWQLVFLQTKREISSISQRSYTVSEYHDVGEGAKSQM